MSLQNPDFFSPEVVGNRWRDNIEARFDALIESRREKPWDWYKFLGIDKADASRIKRGLVIPPEWLRIRIAGYFKIDTSVIWKIPELISADKLEVKDE